MSAPRRTTLWWLRAAVIACALAWAVALVVAFGLRVGFPLELEWMECGTLLQALRHQQGLAVYAAPSAEFAPYLYTPLYPALVAALGFVFPLGYPLARAISALAFAGACAGIFFAVRREGKPVAHAAAAAGLLCAGFVFTFRWYDVARGDSLMLALVVWGLALLRHGGTLRSAALAGLLVGLAFWTKQTAAIFVLASGVACLLSRVGWRRLTVYAAVIALVDGGGVLVGQQATDGWLWTYIYELHQTHAFNAERFAEKTWGMFVHAWPPIAALALALLTRGAARAIARHADEPPLPALWAIACERRDGPTFWVIMAASGLLASALGYATQWAEPNAFIPGVALGAIAVGVALPKDRGEGPALALVVAQLLFCAVIEPRYQPIQSRGLDAGSLRESYTLHALDRTIPPSGLRGRAAALRAELESGPAVFALHRPYWNVLSGGSGHIGAMNLHDIPRGERGRVQGELARALSSGEYGVLWFEGRPPRWLRASLRRGFQRDRVLAGEERVLPMVGYMAPAGMVTPYRRPQERYLRR